MVLITTVQMWSITVDIYTHSLVEIHIHFHFLSIKRSSVNMSLSLPLSVFLSPSLTVNSVCFISLSPNNTLSLPSSFFHRSYHEASQHTRVKTEHKYFFLILLFTATTRESLCTTSTLLENIVYPPHTEDTSKIDFKFISLLKGSVKKIQFDKRNKTKS